MKHIANSWGWKKYVKEEDDEQKDHLQKKNFRGGKKEKYDKIKNVNGSWWKEGRRIKYPVAERDENSFHLDWEIMDVKEK